MPHAVWQGTTTRHSRSVPTRFNTARPSAGPALQGRRALRPWAEQAKQGLPFSAQRRAQHLKRSTAGFRLGDGAQKTPASGGLVCAGQCGQASDPVVGYCTCADLGSAAAGAVASGATGASAWVLGAQAAEGRGEKLTGIGPYR